MYAFSNAVEQIRQTHDSGQMKDKMIDRLWFLSAANPTIGYVDKSRDFAADLSPKCTLPYVLEGQG